MHAYKQYVDCCCESFKANQTVNELDTHTQFIINMPDIVSPIIVEEDQ